MAYEDIPSKNWRIRLWQEGPEALGGKKLSETIMVKHTPCYRCTLGCTPYVEIHDGEYKMAGPAAEYERLAALGSMCMVDNLEAVNYANNLCNLYGIDTIAVGSTIAFGMEATERGLIPNMIDVELTWGNAR